MEAKQQLSTCQAPGVEDGIDQGWRTLFLAHTWAASYPDMEERQKLQYKNLHCVLVSAYCKTVS